METITPVPLDPCGSVHHLAKFLRKHGDNVLDATCKLSLTSSCLADLTKAFAVFPSNNTGIDSFTVVTCSYQTGLFADVVFLYDILQKVTKLKIVTSTRTVQGRISLCQFRKLDFLELFRVAPHLIEGIEGIASQIITLGAHRCLSHFQPLLSIAGGQVWSNLQTLDLSLNVLKSFGGSDLFKSFPKLKHLNLSHNIITKVDLTGLESLVCLDMSYNFIHQVPTVHPKCSFLYMSHLSLRNNLLESLKGIEVLTAIKVLDLGHNMISEFSVLEPLVNLLSLEQLTLEGNPISLHQDYKTGVGAHIAKSVILDNKFDVHSDRMVVITMNRKLDDFIMSDEVPENSGASKSSIRTSKTRKSVIEDPSRYDRHDAYLSRSLEVATLQREVEERRRLDGDAWLVQAAADLMLPTAQSTPYSQRRESRQSDDCIVVKDDASSNKSIETLTIDVDDVETQPRGAIMTTSQTESAGCLLEEVDDLGPPVMAGESDKEESPSSDDQIRVIVSGDDTLTEYQSTTDNESSLNTTLRSAEATEIKAKRSNSGSDTSSVAYRVEQDASVWMRLKEQRRVNVEYDFEHSIDTESKMHLQYVVFRKDEDFEAAFAGHMIVGKETIDGFVVLSNQQILIIGKNVKVEGIVWKSKFDAITKVTVQLGSQSIIVEAKSRDQLDSTWCLIYVGDTTWCGQLAQKLNTRMPESASYGRSEVSPSDLLASINAIDMSLKAYCRGYWGVLEDLGHAPAEKRYVAVAVGNDEIIIVEESHVEPEKVLFKQIGMQQIMALSSISVDERNLCVANLIFTDEASNRDQVWYFETVSVGSLLVFIEALRQPWQDIFDVELPLSFIPAECF